MRKEDDQEAEDLQGGLTMPCMKRQKAKSANRKATKCTAELLAEQDYEIIEIQMVGQDPGSMNIVNLIAVRRRGQPGDYAVIRYEDWTQAPGYKKKTTVPYTIMVEWRGDNREAALRAVARIRADLLANYSWYIPGTKDLVSGCKSGRSMLC